MLGEAEDLGWRVGDSDKCFKISNQIVTFGWVVLVNTKIYRLQMVTPCSNLVLLIDKAEHKIKS